VGTPDEIIREQLADGLEVTGSSNPGIYGDPAGANAPPSVMDLAAAAPTTADIDAMRARLASLEQAQADAAAAAAPPEPEGPPDLTPVLSSSVASDIREAFQQLHERILYLETTLGV
jgi:hypothetical protein